jgi:hypothetical protein
MGRAAAAGAAGRRPEKTLAFVGFSWLFLASARGLEVRDLGFSWLPANGEVKKSQ